MKLIKTSLLALVFFCLATSCQKETQETVIDESNYSIDLNLANETDWKMANEILDLVNAHRATLDLAPIIRDQQYGSAYAVDHTQYMIEKTTISHDHFNVRSGALKEQGAKVVAENVAFGFTDAESVVNAWINSPGHRKTIEGPYTHSGFGVIPSDSGKYYFTQLFYKK